MGTYKYSAKFRADAMALARSSSAARPGYRCRTRHEPREVAAVDQDREEGRAARGGREASERRGHRGLAQAGLRAVDGRRHPAPGAKHLAGETRTKVCSTTYRSLPRLLMFEARPCGRSRAGSGGSACAPASSHDPVRSDRCWYRPLTTQHPMEPGLGVQCAEFRARCATRFRELRSTPARPPGPACGCALPTGAGCVPGTA